METRLNSGFYEPLRPDLPSSDRLSAIQSSDAQVLVENQQGDQQSLELKTFLEAPQRYTQSADTSYTLLVNGQSIEVDLAHLSKEQIIGHLERAVQDLRSAPLIDSQTSELVARIRRGSAAAVAGSALESALTRLTLPDYQPLLESLCPAYREGLLQDLAPLNDSWEASKHLRLYLFLQAAENDGQLSPDQSQQILASPLRSQLKPSEFRAFIKALQARPLDPLQLQPFLPS